MSYNRLMLVRPMSRCGWGFMWAPLAINLEYLAAYVEKDVEDIMIVNQEFDDTDIIDHIKSFKPDLFGVTMSATDHVSGLELCKTAKKFDIPTMVGGYHPTAIPDDLLKFPQVDMVFRGESEVTMKEFLAQGSPEGIDGISYKNNGSVIHNKDRALFKDLDLLPFPARHLRKGDECNRWVSKGGQHRDQVHTSRGCWGRCTFCCEPSMSGSIQRYRSPENVFKEIKEVYKFHDEEPTLIIFGDPHFMGKPELVEQLCDLLISENMKLMFTALVRADSIAKSPVVVEKMVKAGVIGYCMGIESPDVGDLNGTKKGITNKMQADAVRSLRKNHAVAGGTFVIGLPGQTEEDILTFPEFARHLGMINAAFAIATPQAGTEFYDGLEDQGLIHVRDWTLYDQMHSVFKHETISGDRLEQLLTYSLGRFYAPDIFVDDIISAQHRNEEGRKASLSGIAKYMGDRFEFILNAGPQYRPEDGRDYAEIFLGAQINPWTRKRTQLIGIHNMTHLGPFLRAFGEQKVQISVSNGGEPFIHYALKTTKDTVEYLDVCGKEHEDATLTIQLDLATMHQKKGAIALGILSQMAKRRQLTTLIRGGLAFLVDYLAVTKSGKKTDAIVLPPKYLETGCTMSGWDDKA